MCGIAGYILREGVSWTDENSGKIIRAMTNTMKSRGPDDHGTWIDAPDVALGHRRLSVIDLSETGHQPMVSGSGRHVITYNGEIYNFHSLRTELRQRGVRFRGKSDTEVVLEAIEAWGVEKALLKFNGMFALGIWDRQQRQLVIARDRLGEKPLYYGWLDARHFAFASELKALAAHPSFRPEIDPRGFCLYLRYGYIPAPYSIYKGISKLPPGAYMTVTGKEPSHATPDIRYYWRLEDKARLGMMNPLSGREDECLDELEHIALDAVAQRMVSDVPLGVFLSGGLDSTAITALMVAGDKGPVDTFTIGFHEAAYDEAAHARAVAGQLGTRHHEHYVSPGEAMAVIPELALIYDEPFADASQIPMVLLSRMTRHHVTVALSGDGGDEVFGGYNRHTAGPRLWSIFGKIPKNLRTVMARCLLSLTPSQTDNFFSAIGSGKDLARRGEQLHKLAAAITAVDHNDFYQRLQSIWQIPSAVSPSICSEQILTQPLEISRNLDDFRQQMMLSDTLLYLPDDILAKVDRASMSVGLEARAPFLDHRLVEFAWKLPAAVRFRGAMSKWPLQRLLQKRLPPALFKRPKAGFAVPIGDWLRGPLRDWAEALLDKSGLADEGYFDADIVHDAWQLHLSRKRDMQYPLWTVLMFQLWRERWLH